MPSGHTVIPSLKFGTHSVLEQKENMSVVNRAMDTTLGTTQGQTHTTDCSSTLLLLIQRQSQACIMALQTRSGPVGWCMQDTCCWQCCLVVCHAVLCCAAPGQHDLQQQGPSMGILHDAARHSIVRHSHVAHTITWPSIQAHTQILGQSFKHVCTPLQSQDGSVCVVSKRPTQQTFHSHAIQAPGTARGASNSRQHPAQTVPSVLHLPAPILLTVTPHPCSSMQSVSHWASTTLTSPSI